MVPLSEVIHIKVDKALAQKTLEKLKKDGNFLPQFEIRKEGDQILIPVKRAVETEESMILESEPRELKVMPQGHAGSFDLIGDIAIIHERKRLDPKFMVEFILKSKGNVRTIYLDSGIKGEERLRNLKLLHGVDDPVTMYRENNIFMKVDVKGAYFSPRLSTERYLVSRNVVDGEYIFDMFSGIGPFTLNIGKQKKCNIVACDINKYATDLLKYNLSINKLQSKVDVYNEDSYKIIKDLGPFHRIIMNNPVTQYESLDDILKSLIKGGKLNIYMVEGQEMIEERMEYFLKKNMVLESKRVVHGYSRNKSMYSLQYKRETP